MILVYYANIIIDFNLVFHSAFGTLASICYVDAYTRLPTVPSLGTSSFFCSGFAVCLLVLLDLRATGRLSFTLSLAGSLRPARYLENRIAPEPNAERWSRTICSDLLCGWFLEARYGCP